MGQAKRMNDDASFKHKSIKFAKENYNCALAGRFGVDENPFSAHFGAFIRY